MVVGVEFVGFIVYGDVVDDGVVGDGLWELVVGGVCVVVGFEVVVVGEWGEVG